MPKPTTSTMGAKMKSSMGVGAESPRGAPLFEVLSCLPARLGALPGRVAGLDPVALVDAAARHGVSAWVADAFASSKVELPPAEQARLTADARAQIGQGLRIKRLTLAVLEALGKEGLTPVLLKGAGLAQRLFPEQPLARPSSDVDVLVRPEELPAARRAMLALELREQADDSLEDVFEEHHHLSFARPGALVEVHFRLFSGFGGRVFDDASLQARTLEGEFSGRPVRWLAPEDEFIYLATHAANHAFLRLSWLLDLRRFLHVYPGLDWAEMGRRCREAGFQAAVAATLWVLEAALAVDLPPEAHGAFPLTRLRRQGHARLFSPAHVEAADLSAHRVAGFGLRVWLVDSPVGALRHVAGGARRLLRRVRARR